MIIFNNVNDVVNSLNLEKETLEYRLQSQENTKNVILNSIQNFADSTQNVDLKSVDNVVDFLKDLKSSLNLCNENISYIADLLNNIDDLIECANNDIPSFQRNLSYYNLKYVDSNKHILESNQKIEKCMLQISKIAEVKFSKPQANDEIIENSIENSNDNFNNNDSKNDYESVNNVAPTGSSSTSTVESSNTSISLDSSDNKENVDTSAYKENTLIVSERTGHVTLPYTISELNEIKDKNPSKYHSIDSVIAKKYTLPIKVFKNSFIARFKEAFKLMRHREHSSIRDALDLGLELMFCYKLHPAIISACKNLEELDIYLDCLEGGRTDMFECFKIIFELPLAVTRKA